MSTVCTFRNLFKISLIGVVAALPTVSLAQSTEVFGLTMGQVTVNFVAVNLSPESGAPAKPRESRLEQSLLSDLAAMMSEDFIEDLKIHRTDLPKYSRAALLYQQVETRLRAKQVSDAEKVELREFLTADFFEFHNREQRLRKNILFQKIAQSTHDRLEKNTTSFALPTEQSGEDLSRNDRIAAMLVGIYAFAIHRADTSNIQVQISIPVTDSANAKWVLGQDLKRMTTYADGFLQEAASQRFQMRPDFDMTKAVWHYLELKQVIYEIAKPTTLSLKSNCAAFLAAPVRTLVRWLSPKV